MTTWRRNWEREAIERAARLKMKGRLIAAGYRALAARLHPDTGGSTEDMARLTNARDELIDALGGKPKERKRHLWVFGWVRITPRAAQ